MRGASRSRELGLLLTVGVGAAAAALVLSDRSPAELALLFAFCGIGVLTLRYPLIGLSALMAMVVSNLSNNLIVDYGAPSVAKLAAPGLMALLGARYALWGDRPYLGWTALAFLAGFLMLRLLGATYAVDWSLSLGAASDFVKNAVVALLAVAFMNRAHAFATVMLTAVLTVATICALGAWHMLAGDLPAPLRTFAAITENSGRFSGPIEDANFFAAVIVLTVPMGLFQMLDARNAGAALLWAAVAGLLIFGLLATQSRGGILAVAVGLGVLVFALTRRQRLAAACVAVLGVIVIPVLASDQLIERLGTIAEVVTTETAVDKSTEGRLASWQVAVEIFKDSPWLGVGAENFNILYQDMALDLGLIFRGEGRSTHSLYLEILSEQGLLGLVFFLGMLATAAASIRSAAAAAIRAGRGRLARRYIAFGAGLAGYLTAMAFLQDSYPRLLWIVIAIGLELGALARTRLTTGPQGPAEARVRKPVLVQ